MRNFSGECCNGSDGLTRLDGSSSCSLICLTKGGRVGEGMACLIGGQAVFENARQDSLGVANTAEPVDAFPSTLLDLCEEKGCGRSVEKG